MRVSLVGNYGNSADWSMERFTDLLRFGLQAAGHDVRILRPPSVLGHFFRGETGMPKWVGYVDRFVFYPLLLRWQIRSADVVHICDQANAVYVPHTRSKPTVVTCHDMLAIRAALGLIPEFRSRWSGRIYQRWILRRLRTAPVIACDSRQTSEMVRQLTPLPPDRVSVIPISLNYPFRPMPGPEAARYLRGLHVSDRQPYLLHVGGNQWYKNRGAVARIVAELIKKPPFHSYHLVLVGKRRTRQLRSLCRDLGIDDRVVELVGVSNEELCALYTMASALVFPSLYEDFGWPILEAQACGCPVVTTNRAPMTEVGGDAAEYFNPSDIPAAAKTVADVLKDPEPLRRAGLANVRRFPLATMIDAYLRLYTQLISATGSQAHLHNSSVGRPSHPSTSTTA